MFVDAIGIILADDKRVHLSELTRPRALAAVPIAAAIASSILACPIWCTRGFPWLGFLP